MCVCVCLMLGIGDSRSPHSESYSVWWCVFAYPCKQLYICDCMHTTHDTASPLKGLEVSTMYFPSQASGGWFCVCTCTNNYVNIEGHANGEGKKHKGRICGKHTPIYLYLIYLPSMVAMYWRICRTSSSEPEFSRNGHFSSRLSPPTS